MHTSESKAYIVSFPAQSKLARKSRRVIRQINIPFGALDKYDCSSSKEKGMIVAFGSNILKLMLLEPMNRKECRFGVSTPTILATSARRSSSSSSSFQRFVFGSVSRFRLGSPFSFFYYVCLG